MKEKDLSWFGWVFAACLVIVMQTIFQALNKFKKLNLNKVSLCLSLFLTIYLLFKSHFVAW